MRAAAHTAISGASAFALISMLRRHHPTARLPDPVFAAVVAAIASGLPDLLEPASSPHHRKFCHSAAFAVIVTTGMRKLYDWMPATPGEAFMRDALLGIGFGYMTHLCADATTPLGLPLLGTIS
ncbi:MAG: metal-dependent hydrolase [Betaproteobacteria bacterium]|nr:MAG: metal-dependent hydrolase [Betaproteobacteria bacterium]